MLRGTVTLKRWKLISVFILLTLSFVIGLYSITHQYTQYHKTVQFIQESRTFGCKINYQLFRDMLNITVHEIKKDQNGNLTKAQIDHFAPFYKRTDPHKCILLTTKRPKKGA